MRMKAVYLVGFMSLFAACSGGESTSSNAPRPKVDEKKPDEEKKKEEETNKDEGKVKELSLRLDLPAMPPLVNAAGPASIAITLSCAPSEAKVMVADDLASAIDCGENVSLVVPRGVIPEGEEGVKVTAFLGDKTEKKNFPVSKHTSRPVLSITSPESGDEIDLQVSTTAVFSGACDKTASDVSLHGVTAPCDAGGHFTASLDVSGLAEGDHPFSATQTDSYGNTGTSNVVSLHITPVPDAAPSPDAPAVTATSVAGAPKPTWTWVSGGGGNGTYRVKIDSTDLSTGAQTIVGTTFTAPSNLSPGSHTLYVQESNSDGLWSAAGSASATVYDVPAQPTTSPYVTNAKPVMGMNDNIVKLTWAPASEPDVTYSIKIYRRSIGDPGVGTTYDEIKGISANNLNYDMFYNFLNDEDVLDLTGEYRFRFAVENIAGTSPYGTYSGWIQFVTQSPDEATNLSFTHGIGTDYTVQMDWDEPASGQYGVPLETATVTIYNGSNCTAGVEYSADLAIGVKTATVDVSADGTYSFMVTLTDQLGNASTSVCSNDLPVPTN